MTKKRTFWEPVRVRSAYFDEDMAAAKRSERAILLSPNYGFVDSDLSRLREHPWLQNLDLYDTKFTSCSGLEALENLEWLSLRYVPDKLLAGIDCTWFPKLRSLSTPLVPKLRLPPEHSAIEGVSLSRYRPKSQDLTELPAWPKLERLAIFGGGGLHSLNGIGRFRSLTGLTLNWIRNLDSVAPLADARVLKSLWFDSCSRLASLDGIEKCSALEELVISKCKSIKSVLPAARLPRLASIRVVLSPVPKSEAEHFKHVPDCQIVPRIGMKEIREFIDPSA